MKYSWAESPDLALSGGDLQIAGTVLTGGNKAYGNLEIPARWRSDLEIWRSGVPKLQA